MLQALREKSSGWIATVVLGLLIVPFAFFGMEQYLFQQNDTYVARIEAPPAWWPQAPSSWLSRRLLWQREDIETDAFRTAFEQERQRVRSENAEGYDARAFESTDNKRAVLDRLVDQSLLKLLAQNEGIQVGDAQVRRTIQGIPAFQANGQFNAQRYQQALAAQTPARTPRQFEQLVREGLQQSAIPEALTASAFVTNAETDRLLRLLGESRNVDFALIAPVIDANQPVTDAEIKQWYDSHTADFRAPERVTLEYLEVDGKALPASVIDEDTLRRRYDEQKGRLGQPAQRLVSHILVEVPAGADAATQKAAEDEARKLATQAKAPGADFAALAKARSDDAGSKAGGGDLGWIAQDGTMVKPFEDAVFAMQAGQISDPVKSDFGWHVIQLREVREGQVQAFEQVREQLLAEAQASQGERAYNELMGKLVDEVNKSPGTLAGAAQVLGRPVATIGPFARGEGEGIAANPAVQKAAFSELLIQDGTVSEPIELGDSHGALIRVARHTPAQAQPLAEVREAVIAAIRQDRAGKAAAATAQAMIKDVQGGKAFNEAAAARNLPTQNQPDLKRGMPTVDPELMEAVFTAPVPAPGKPPSLGHAPLPGGAVAVFAVRSMTPGDPKQAQAAERSMLTGQLSQIDGDNAARALVDALRKRSRITVVEDRL